MEQMFRKVCTFIQVLQCLPAVREGCFNKKSISEASFVLLPSPVCLVWCPAQQWDKLLASSKKLFLQHLMEILKLCALGSSAIGCFCGTSFFLLRWVHIADRINLVHMSDTDIFKGISSQGRYKFDIVTGGKSTHTVTLTKLSFMESLH